MQIAEHFEMNQQETFGLRRTHPRIYEAGKALRNIVKVKYLIC